MTNKIFKDYYKNKPIIDAANDTVKVMCIVLLTAHKLFPKVMYPKAICRFIEDRTEYCKISDGYEQDGVFDYKMQRACEEIALSTADCIAIVNKYMRPPCAQVMDVYINNVRLLFVQLNAEHGIGIDRRERLVAALLSDQAETDQILERIQEMGADIDVTTFSGVDYKKYRVKPQKEASIKDQKAAAKGMEWLRAYQNDVMKGGK